MAYLRKSSYEKAKKSEVTKLDINKNDITGKTHKQTHTKIDK